MNKFICLCYKLLPNTIIKLLNISLCSLSRLQMSLKIPHIYTHAHTHTHTHIHWKLHEIAVYLYKAFIPHTWKGLTIWHPLGDIWPVQLWGPRLKGPNCSQCLQINFQNCMAATVTWNYSFMVRKFNWWLWVMVYKTPFNEFLRLSTSSLGGDRVNWFWMFK